MRQLLDSVWQRRGTSWLWDEEARNTVCAAGEVWSLRQFLQAVGHWPDDLPSNRNNTLVVVGLEGASICWRPRTPRLGWAMGSRTRFCHFSPITRVKRP